LLPCIDNPPCSQRQESLRLTAEPGIGETTKL
jgi:hypothetical protein